MYDRAPRQITLANVTSTDVHVGPGSYEVSFRKDDVSDGYAPFLSLAARESTLVSTITEDDAPGPAHYNVGKIKYNIKGGLSLKNRETRFKKPVSDNPGPGAYYGPCSGELGIKNWKLKEAKQPSYLCHDEHSKKTTTGLIVTDVPTSFSEDEKTPKRSKVFRYVDVPSIPSPGQSHGYHINDDGSVLKQSAPFVDKTLGPAFYKPLFDASDSTLKYKGVHFGNQSGRRDLPVVEGPGPGDYDILQESTLHYENVNIKKDEKLKSCPFLPRYHEEIVRQEVKKAQPFMSSISQKWQGVTIRWIH